MPMDWQTVVSRRARKETPDKGGWNIFFTTNITLDLDNPGTNSFAVGCLRQGLVRLAVRSRRLQKLRAAFITRDRTRPSRRNWACAISDRVMNEAIYAPVGQYKAFGAYRKDRLSGWLRRPVPVVWNISKK